MTAAYGQLAAAMALVGVNVAVGKVLADAMPVLTVLALRCALATLVVLPLVWRGLRFPARGAALNLLVQAGVGTVLYNAALLGGMRLTGALEAGLMLATLPAAVAVGAWAFLREPLAPRGLAAALLAGGGMAVLAWGQGEALHGSAAGYALLLLAVCGEAAYVLLAKANAGRVAVLPAVFWMQVFSAAALLPFADFGAALDMPPPIAGLLVFHSLTASVLAVVLWYAGLRRVPGSVAGVFSGVLPLTAGAVAVLVLHEPLTAAHGVGAGLMLASMALATAPGRRAAAATTRA